MAIATETLRHGKRRLGAVAALMAVAVLAVGMPSARAADQAAGQTPKNMLPIRIAWLPGTCGRLYAARAFDLFKKAGLDAELVRFNNGPAMNAAFQSGSVDIGYSGAPGFLVSLASGTPMKVFALENEADAAEGLVAKPDSGIRSVKDLPGKSVGTSIGTTAWVGLLTALEKTGADPSQVKIVDLKLNAVVPAFKRNDVSAVWIWAPWMFDLEDAGGKLITTDSEWLVNGNVWIGRTEWLDKNREAVLRFLKALDEATRKIETNRPEVAKFMAEQMGITVSVADKLLTTVKFPTLSTQIRPDYKVSLSAPGQGEDAVLKRVADLFVKHGMLKKMPPLTGAIDPSFIQDYERQK